MKKGLVIALTFFLLLTGCSSSNESMKEPEYITELKELGYQQEVIDELTEKLTTEELNKLTEFDYVEVLLDILNSKDYKAENLEKYLKYYEAGMNGEAVVYIVNNDIHYTYNEKLVSIMNHEYFIAENLDRYMSYESDNTDFIVRAVNSNIDKEVFENLKTTDTAKNELMLVNKYYQLPSSYQNKNMVYLSSKYTNKSGQRLNKEAYDAFKKLVEAGEKEGIYIRAMNTFQNASTVEKNYTASDDVQKDKTVFRSGHSEHQTGLAVDVNKKGAKTEEEWISSKEAEWMQENAYLYGFILRYPEDKKELTGYDFIPCHYRYVGVDAATYIKEKNITFEEYYAYFVEQDRQIEQ